MNRQGTFPSILLVAVGVILATAAAAGTITTGPLNKAGFQALVDSAAKGDTISCLGGVYDFSDHGAVLITKRLSIVAADPRDPPLFVGDTVDGSVEGDPVIGTDRLSGNAAFATPPGASVEALKLAGLSFTGFDYAIDLHSGYDQASPGCPLVPGSGLSHPEILDNTIRQTRRGIGQGPGGPFEHFVFKGNDIRTSTAGDPVAIIVGGDRLICAFDGSQVNTLRPSHGRIEGNHLESNVGVFVISGEHVSIKQNRIEGGTVGVFVVDYKALFFPDDGPIYLGEVKHNEISGSVLGILAEGPTTISGAQIKGNRIRDAVAPIVLDLGANGFEIKGNEFFNSLLAEIYLGFDESGSGGEYPPDTHDNVVKARAGDLVLDFGVDNVVKIRPK